MTLTHVEPLQPQTSQSLKRYLPVTGVVHHVAHFFLGQHESVLQGKIQLRRVWVVLREVVSAQVLLHLILHVEWQPVLEEATDLPTVLAVAITDRKEVTVLQAHDVR